MARSYAAASTMALALLFTSATFAQTYHDTGGSVVPGVVPLGGDGSGPLFTSGNPAKVSGIFSATLSGFQPTPAYSYQSVTTSSAAYALPSGTSVVVYNTGSNPITIRLGGSGVSVISGQADVVPAGGWMAFTVGSATDYAVVGNGGASTVVVSGGSGLPTGSGGGSGGSAGGTVAQGPPALTSSAWPVAETVAGSVVSSSNPVPISFGSGATLPSFASPPMVNIGAAPTVSVAQSGPWSDGRTWALGSGTDSITIGAPLPAFASPPTVIANAGTNLNTSALATDAHLTSVIGSASGGTAAASSVAGGGVYNSTLPTLTNGQQAAEQLDSSGRQLVNVGALPTLTPVVKTALSNSAVSVKASAGLLGAVNCDNTNSSAVVVEIFNTASPTLGTTAPAWFMAIQPGGGGSNLPTNVSLGGSAIYAAAVTAFNGSSAPTNALNCSIGVI